MTQAKNRGGRPLLTEAQKTRRKTDILQRIEPYLKSGLSVYKALRETKIHNSEFYKFMAEDELFREKVVLFKQYISVLLNQAIFNELLSIIERQNTAETRGSSPRLPKEDTDFLWRYTLNSNLCKEEWGRRQNINLFDPELETQKIKGIREDRSLE